jgi:hypothetical protein
LFRCFCFGPAWLRAAGCGARSGTLHGTACFGPRCLVALRGALGNLQVQGEAKLAYLGHVIVENRNGLAVAGCVTEANGYAERAAAPDKVQALPGSQRRTLGADKAHDTRGSVAAVRRNGLTPQVARNTTHKGSAIHAGTTRHVGTPRAKLDAP